VIEYRCVKCGRLLFKADAAAGRIQIPCPRCETIQMVALKAAPTTRLTAVPA
jgi:phage FluMu protein Com